MMAVTLSLTLMMTVAQAASPGAQETQVRSVLMPARGQPVEVFVRPFDTQHPWVTASAVVLPARIQTVEADADAEVRAVGSRLQQGEWGERIEVSSRRAVETGPGVAVWLVLVDGSSLELRLVTRPGVRDVVLTIKKFPHVSPEESARLAQERLFRGQSLGEAISVKTKLIAERGSEAVINRTVGDGFSFKQTIRVSISFVDVVQDAGISYSTLMIKNRSDMDWPVDLEHIKLVGPDSQPVKVLSRSSQRSVIPPKKESRIVLSYETPASPAELFVSVSEQGRDLPSLLVMVVP